MRFIRDTIGWAILWVFIQSGAARAAFDGAFFAYFRPEWEKMIESLPEFIKWIVL